LEVINWWCSFVVNMLLKAMVCKYILIMYFPVYSMLNYCVMLKWNIKVLFWRNYLWCVANWHKMYHWNYFNT
jgi:hypothetical protein